MIRSLEDQGIQRLYPQSYGELLLVVSACKRTDQAGDSLGEKVRGSWAETRLGTRQSVHSLHSVVISSFTFADRKAELKKLNRSILICFLELLDILINNPASPNVRSCETSSLTS